MLNLLPRVPHQARVFILAYAVAATTVSLATPRAADPVSGDAFDAATGKILWRTELPGAPGGGIITYVIDGKQRVAIASGTHSPAFPVTPSSAKIQVFGL